MIIDHLVELEESVSVTVEKPEEIPTVINKTESSQSSVAATWTSLPKTYCTPVPSKRIKVNASGNGPNSSHFIGTISSPEVLNISDEDKDGNDDVQITAVIPVPKKPIPEIVPLIPEYSSDDSEYYEPPVGPRSVKDLKMELEDTTKELDYVPATFSKQETESNNNGDSNSNSGNS